MGTADENEALSQPAGEIWAFDWKIGSVLQGDCYTAESIEDKNDVVIWLSREPLSEEQLEQFMAHVERLFSIRDWGEAECGVDSERRGFVVLAHGSTKKIDFDHPGSIALRNRFLSCVALISQIHARGVGCGNISPGSFVIDSLGDIRFIGFLGGYGEKLTSKVSLDIRAFSVVGDGAVGAPSVTADVYALAVLGLELFGAQFPPASIDAAHLDEYVAKVRADAPPWVISVLATIVREPKRVFCRDAEELIRSLSKSDTEYLKSSALKNQGDVTSNQDEPPLTIEQICDKYSSAEDLRKRRIVEFARSKYVKLFGIAFIGVIIAWLFLSQLDIFTRFIPVSRAAKSDRTEKDEIVTDVANALAILRKVDSSRATGERPASSLALLSKEGAESGQGQSQQLQDGVGDETPRKVRIEADNIILASVANGSVTPEERQAVFALYGDLDDESKARLAAVLAKAGGDSERMFRESLEAKVRRGLSVTQRMPEKISTDALFLAAETRLTPEVAQVWGRGAVLSDEELRWLIRVHVRKRSTIVPFLARLVLERQLVPWPRSVFFEVMAQSSERSGTPYEVLVHAAEDEITVAEANLLISWEDPLSIRVLYVVLLLSSDAETLRTVMSGLMGKPLLGDALRTIVEVSLADGLSSTKKYAKLIGALGSAWPNSESVLKDELVRLRGDTKQELIVSTLIEKGAASVVASVLMVFGEEVHPDTLIHLLDRSEPGVRMAVIPFLRGVRIASSKALIRERYQAEQDPEVRRIFETVLFPSS